MWHWVMLKVWRSETNPTHLYIPADEEETRHVGMLQTSEQTREFFFSGSAARASLSNWKWEIPLYLFGETSFASIRLGVMLVALGCGSKHTPTAKWNRTFEKKSMSERPRQPEYGFGSEMAKTEFKFPILVMFLSNNEFSLNAIAAWPSLCRRPGRLQPYPFIKWDDVWMCGPVNSVYGIICWRAQKSYKVMGYHSLYIVLVLCSALLNQVEAIPVSSLLLEQQLALAIIHDCLFWGVVGSR